MSRYETLSDPELLLCFQKGERDAFTEIYQRYWTVLFLHARNLLRQDEEARDIVQELFTHLWHKGAGLQPQVSLSGYLYRAVRNRVLDQIRKNKTAGEYIASVNEFLLSGQVETDALLREHELAGLIEAEILRLPEKMRAVFELSRKQHLSYREIAEQLGVTEHTVKSQISNALRILRAKLGPAGIALLFYLDTLHKN